MKKLEGAEGEDEPMPQMKQVSTLSERYNPTPEEIKQTYPYLDELFMKHGDDLIFQDNPNGKELMHIFFLYKKFYKCIRRGCKSHLVIEEIPQTKTQKGKEEKEEAQEHPKEGGPSKEDHKVKEDVEEEEKGAIPKKRKPRKKKSNKKGKNKGQVNPKEEPGKPEEKEK